VKVILAAIFAIPGALLAFGMFYLIGMWWLFPPIFVACLFYAWKTRRPAVKPTGDFMVACDCQEWWAQARTYAAARELLDEHIEHDCRLYSMHRWLVQNPVAEVEPEPFTITDSGTAGTDDGLGRSGKITDLDG
jgi:hypothetical protein